MMQKRYIITEEELAEMLYDFYNGFLSDGSAIATKVRSCLIDESDKVIVYSRIIKKSPFVSIKEQELALKDIEADGYGWTSLGFKLEIGDEMRVLRKQGGDV